MYPITPEESFNRQQSNAITQPPITQPPITQPPITQPPIPEVHRVMDQLGTGINRVAAMTVELEKRLEPVLLPVPPAKDNVSAEKQSSCGSRLAASVLQMDIRVTEAILHLESIMSRLAV